MMYTFAEGAVQTAGEVLIEARRFPVEINRIRRTVSFIFQINQLINDGIIVAAWLLSSHAMLPCNRRRTAC